MICGEIKSSCSEHDFSEASDGCDTNVVGFGDGGGGPWEEHKERGYQKLFPGFMA